MKLHLCIAAAGLLMSPLSALAGANCVHSQSWQCGHTTSSTATQTQTGTNPGVAATLPPDSTGAHPLGTVTVAPDIQQSVLVPLKPKVVKPSRAPVVEPPTALPPQSVPTPMSVPPLPPNQAGPGQVPAPVLPPQRTPGAITNPIPVPPLPPSQAGPGQVPAPVLPPQVTPGMVPNSITTPKVIQTHRVDSSMNTPPALLPIQKVPLRLAVTVAGLDGKQTLTAHESVVGNNDHSHALLHHEPNAQHPLHTGEEPMLTPYTLEFIEPGLQQHKVEVYRSQDAKELIYKDTIPLDRGVFQLIVIGTRNPAYAH